MLVWAILSHRPSPPPPLPSQAAQTSDKRLSGLSFHFSLRHHLPCHHIQPRRATSTCLGFFFTSLTLTISSSPDERLALVWTILSPHHLPYHHSAQMSNKHSSGLSSFTTTSLAISFSPDNLQVLVRASLAGLLVLKLQQNLCLNLLKWGSSSHLVASTIFSRRATMSNMLVQVSNLPAPLFCLTIFSFAQFTLPTSSNTSPLRFPNLLAMLPVITRSSILFLVIFS